jgi:hypothetical protein
MAPHPLAVKALVPVLFFLSALSIPSGALLVLSPDGRALGAQTILPHLEQQVPFLKDFAPVGWFLLVVYGLLPLGFVYGLWTRRRWAWVLTFLLGVTQVVWIAAEVAMFYDLGFFIFYPIIAGMGVATLALCVLPSARRYFVPASA